MSISSIFLPKEGLQGEDMPSHIIWKDMDYNIIRIELPTILKLKEIYNVSEDQWEFNHNILTIKSVLIDGYLGLLFESIRSIEENEEYVEVLYQFINNKNEVIFQTIKRICLFRPSLILSENPPHHINIIFPEKEIDNKVKLTNVGSGTAILRIETTKDSEIQDRPSDTVIDFMDEFINDLEKEINRLKEEFPDYSQFLDKFYLFEINPDWNVTDLNAEIEQLAEKDEDFIYEFGNSLGLVIMNNMHFDILFESFISYMKSLPTNKILLYNPLDIIDVSEEPKTLSLKILQKDLLMKDYDSIEIPLITISANKADVIELHKLFEWGEYNEK